MDQNDIPDLSGKTAIVTGANTGLGYETASILGKAIGKPDLKWIVISDEQLISGMKAFGLNESLA